MSTVLIITEPSDLTSDLVVAALAKHPVDIFRFDLSDFPTKVGFHAFFGNEGDGEIWNDRRSTRLSDVTGVLYRRPTWFRFSDELSSAEKEFCFEEARRGFGGTLSTLNCTWVNHPAKSASADYKPHQLKVARESGFSVPSTLVTNSAETARNFVRRSPAPILCKSLLQTYCRINGEYRGLYASLLTAQDVDLLDGVKHTAHLFQAWVDKKYDVRLTAVADKCFAVAVQPVQEEGKIDWRRDPDATFDTPIDVPQPVTAAVQKYLSSFGLSFGAFDFVVTPTGEWYFLECNPDGQWGQLSIDADLPIADAIADHLTQQPTIGVRI